MTGDAERSGKRGCRREKAAGRVPTGGLILVFLAVAATGAFSGCSGRSKPVPPPPQMNLAVQVDAAVNQRQIFYMVVRMVNDKQFLTESYQTISSQMFCDPPDPTVLGAFPLIPGQRKEINVTKPTQNSLALYFLFTGPRDQWKKLLSQPLASSYEVVLGEQDIVINEKKSLLRRMWPF